MDKKQSNMKTYKINTGGGDKFTDVFNTAKEIAISKNVIVEYDFNGVSCLVGGQTDLDYLWRDYLNSWAMNWEKIGPDCVKKYDANTQKELDKRNSEKEAKRIEEQRQYELKIAEQKKALFSKIDHVELKLKDGDAWQKSRSVNKDPYGKAALDYAEYWAKLMQYEISNGKTISDCAESTSHEADIDGITGFMYGCAVNILSKTWEYGEELRKWHNKEYGHECDGVVNPAVLTISNG